MVLINNKDSLFEFIQQTFKPFNILTTIVSLSDETFCVALLIFPDLRVYIFVL